MHRTKICQEFFVRCNIKPVNGHFWPKSPQIYTKVTAVRQSLRIRGSHGDPGFAIAKPVEQPRAEFRSAGWGQARTANAPALPGRPAHPESNTHRNGVNK
jgi:hypothetical protein